MMHCGSKMAADYYGIMVGMKESGRARKVSREKNFLVVGLK